MKSYPASRPMPVTFWTNPERTRELRLAFPLALACASFLVPFASPSHAQNASIGLYTDATGQTCSFSGDALGTVTAHVVVRPTMSGLTGVQFSAPIPECFKATYVNETLAPGVVSIGSSQTGISLAFPSCAGQPYAAMQITYYRYGGTSACCEYPILADPSQTSILASDCTYQDVPIATVHTHFNADASCDCVGNSAPISPNTPYPADHANNAGVHTDLSWVASDDDGNIVEYDVYLGISPSPPLVATVAVPSYKPATLSPLTPYYWRVVARDAFGQEASGPEWTFTTRVLNLPPFPPSNPMPANGASDIPENMTLRWVGGDIDPDTLTYDVYFGGTPNPPLLVAGLTDPIRIVNGLDFVTTYYWRVVSHDPLGEETEGPLWSFTTKPENYPPGVPSSPSPSNGAVMIWPTQELRWSGWDVEDYDTLTYDVYLGASATPPLLVSNISTNRYTPTGLSYSTQYYWRIVAHDRDGAETSGPVWTYTTRDENYPPNPPSSPSPANNSTNRPLNQTLAWAATDPDGQGPQLVFDVYFGTASPPPLVASGVTLRTFNPGPLALLTTYRWRVVARDPFGAETSGPTWSFTTRTNAPPNVPTSPTPANNAVNRSIQQTLAWAATDPNGDALVFDLYFGTTPSPPLLTTNIAAKSYAPGPLQFLTTYYWRVVARDIGGAETSGPTWTFSTRANSPPTTPNTPTPPNNGASDNFVALAWRSGDVDGQPLAFSLYFGQTSPPPLLESGLTEPLYDLGSVPNGVYYWSVSVSDGITSVAGPVWRFTATQMGDANLDGAVTLADATCAFDAFLGLPNCPGSGVADVDCNGQVTPRDARCIHKNVLDGSCTFCGNGAATLSQTTLPPVVSLLYTWEQNDTVYARLNVSGVPTLQSFGFYVFSDVPLLGVRRLAATNAFSRLSSSWSGYTGIVGGYSLSGTSLQGPTELVDLLFRPDIGGFVAIELFTDDLTGALPFYFYLQGGGTVPTLISRFDASSVDGGVELRWELRSDEPLSSYVLYRRDHKESTPSIVSQGPIVSPVGHYLDRTIQYGKTYYYELVVRTPAGDEFRSPIATVTTGSLSLSLGQNHPNPFNPRTSIPYELPATANAQRVRLWILDISGRIVTTLVNEDQPGGSYRVEWQGKDDRGEAVSSGVYFYVLDVNGERRTRKLVLLK